MSNKRQKSDQGACRATLLSPTRKPPPCRCNGTEKESGVSLGRGCSESPGPARPGPIQVRVCHETKAWRHKCFKRCVGPQHFA
jgi:hypothetical protein